MRRSLPVISSSLTFRFVVQSVKFLGTEELIFQTIEHAIHIQVLLNMIAVDVSARIRLKVLDYFGIIADNVSNRLWHHVDMSE